MRHMRLLIVVLLLLSALVVSAQDEMNTDALVNVASSEALGSHLVGPDGRTLYRFVPDDANCTGTCLENWPPLTVESEDELTAAEGIPGVLGTYEREDGTLQVTYNDMPLYNFIRDEAAGDANGQGINNVWYVVEPVMLYVAGNTDLGNFLVGPQGMTLYLFTPDDANCVDACLENWPPLTTENVDDVTVSRSLAGEIDTFEREDGTLQVTYNGTPLYYFAADEAIGDSNGQGVNDVWYVINTIGTRTDEAYGEYLVGPNGRSLYLFTPDDANCTGTCLENWPPLTAAVDEAIALGAGLSGEISFFDRDGMMQVSYNGVPLYYWQGDAAPGDTTGQGMNDVWFLVSPEGEAITGDS
jgi:predicted lipoprotein with Yx(FWY)xxD motif